MTKPLIFTGAFKLSRKDKKCLMDKFNHLKIGIKTIWLDKQSDMESQVYTCENDYGETFYDVGVRIGDNVCGFDHLRMNANVFEAILNNNVKFHISKVPGVDLYTVELDDIGATVLNEV